MSLEFKRLLTSDSQLPARIRAAITTGHIHEAGKMLMSDFGLDCSEVSLLLDEPLCRPAECSTLR